MDVRRSWSLGTAIRLVLPALLAMAAAGSDAAERGVGFLIAETSVDGMGPESQAAWALARELAPATLVAPTGDGGFADSGGRAAMPVSCARLFLDAGRRSRCGSRLEWGGPPFRRRDETNQEEPGMAKVDLFYERVG